MRPRRPRRNVTRGSQARGRSSNMTVKTATEPKAGHGAPSDPRKQLLADLAVSERRLALAGVSTAVLEAGEGPPVVLLHEPGSFAAQWLRVLPEIARGHRVIAPDLPGHGASDIGDAELDAERVLAWLSELIERTCESPPALVGHLGSGAIAARLALAKAPSPRSV